jgi:RNA polymerase sigma factor (sigma-70 family)
MSIQRGGTDGTVEWVRALKRREEWAWEQLHEQTLDRVFAYVHLRVRRREDAEDLTAEVYAAAVASIEQFRGDASVLTWLIAIARRKVIDDARRRRRRPEVLEADLALSAPDSDPSFDARGHTTENLADALERRETAGRIRGLVLRLPQAQREALLLRCVDELSLTEIARVLGRSENAVKGLLHRAKSAVLASFTAENRPPRPDQIPQEDHDAGPFLSSARPVPPPAPVE